MARIPDDWIITVESDKLGTEVQLKGYRELVMCKNCKFYHGVNEECGCNGGYHSEDWYCADGERRDGDA